MCNSTKILCVYLFYCTLHIKIVNKLYLQILCFQEKQVTVVTGEPVSPAIRRSLYDYPREESQELSLRSNLQV